VDGRQRLKNDEVTPHYFTDSHVQKPRAVRATLSCVGQRIGISV